MLGRFQFRRFSKKQWMVMLAILGVAVLYMRAQLNRYKGIATSKATGLSAVVDDSLASRLIPQTLVPLVQRSRSARVRKLPVDFSRVDMSSGGGRFSGVIGGVPGNPPPPARDGEQGDGGVGSERMLLRTGTLQIDMADPALAAEQLRELAEKLSGFVVSSRVYADGQGAESADVVVRIPAGRFDEARQRIRAMAKTVEEDTVEARDVTSEHVDQVVRLRNARVEEAQYLAILKHATTTKDVLDATEKLDDVRMEIDRTDAARKVMEQQVEMALLTTNIRAVGKARGILAIHWRPLEEAKEDLRGALIGWADYANSMVELLLNIPVIVVWAFTIMLILKLAWMMLRKLVRLFFPGFTWRRLGEQAA
jgi:uncharacterized protein DUF4349